MLYGYIVWLSVLAITVGSMFTKRMDYKFVDSDDPKPEPDRRQRQFPLKEILKFLNSERKNQEKKQKRGVMDMFKQWKEKDIKEVGCLDNTDALIKKIDPKCIAMVEPELMST